MSAINPSIANSVTLAEVRGTQAADRLKTADPKDSAKIRKSAHDFEAVLLSHWLEQAEQSFASVPGSDKDQDADPGRDQFHSIAMQAVATALSGAHGGLGIASMVEKGLEKAHQAHRPDGNLQQTNDLHKDAGGVSREGTRGAEK